MATFTGVLAVLHRTTADGSRLDDPDPEFTRPLPLPLVRPGESVIGRIDYSGQLDDDHPDTEEIAAEIRDGRLVGALDADLDEMEYRHRGRAVFEPEMAALDDDPHNIEVIMKNWSVAAATLMPSEGKAWPEVSLTLDEED